MFLRTVREYVKLGDPENFFPARPPAEVRASQAQAARAAADAPLGEIHADPRALAHCAPCSGSVHASHRLRVRLLQILRQIGNLNFDAHTYDARS